MIPPDHIYIIAEAGVNHNGSVELAKRMIEAASIADVDAVKFQTYRTEYLTSTLAPKAEYQINISSGEESQFEMLQKYELDAEAHESIFRYCTEKGIQFLSSPFDQESLDLLVNRFRLPMIKIASGEITNAPLLLKAAQSNRDIILSTGMSSLEEVEAALSVLAFGYMGKKETPSLQRFNESYRSKEGRHSLQEKVTLLHCTSEYPAPYQSVNLRAMDAMRIAFGLRVGFSDHTEGIEIAVAAAACGAAVIEKHFTLDRNMPGPDHKASLEPEELKRMVCSIRNVERALGVSLKVPSVAELKNRVPARKSIVAATDIKKGDRFSEKNITTKRPGTGVGPFHYWQRLGMTADRDYRKDDLII
jgi:N-acetylneuraminate synthase